MLESGSEEKKSIYELSISALKESGLTLFTAKAGRFLLLLKVFIGLLFVALLGSHFISFHLGVRGAPSPNSWTPFIAAGHYVERVQSLVVLIFIICWVVAETN